MWSLTKLLFATAFACLSEIVLTFEDELPIPTTESCNGAEDGMYPNPDDCFSFIHCVHAKPHLLKCPGNLKFDSPKRICNHGHLVKCGSSCGGKPDGIYENPEDCNTFFKCVYGKSYKYNCPHQLMFNPALGICDFPQDFICFSGGIPG